MKKNIMRSAVTALALGATLATTMVAPAMAADGQTSTRNILLGAAAAAGIFTAINVEHKHQLATTIQGYLPNGDAVYQDGHVVSRNGQTWYPGNNGKTVACSNQSCTIQGSNNYSRYNNYGYNNSGRYNDGRNSGTNNYAYNNDYNGRHYRRRP
jgi:hypothetical protein